MRHAIQRSQAAQAVFALLLLLLAQPASARLAPEQVCDHVAQVASQQTGVPLSVLQAITRTETGRKKGGRFTPWPWTVNMEGKGVWFDTLDEARSYVFREFKRGARSFDVGCFQLNYKWHHQGFTSIDQMFDPQANALYAAEFLKDLYAEKGNWSDAAGAYHSRTPKYANRYKAIFEKHRRRAGGSETIQTAAAPAARARPAPCGCGSTAFLCCGPLPNPPRRGWARWFPSGKAPRRRFPAPRPARRGRSDRRIGP
ncbi:MAG: transglycosylase SLT domain-containing protein [Paracoccaceae bacterium]